MEAKHPMLPYRIFDDGSMLKTRGSGFKQMTKGTSGYSQFSCYGKVWLAHRVIWEAFNGEIPDGFQINHIDGNKANNRIENLRAATKEENCQNQKVRSTNTSGCKGVKWNSVSKKWQVGICKNYKNIHLGMYEDLELASLVAMEATELIHGRFSAYKGVLNGK
jgi:hypothetical protein